MKTITNLTLVTLAGLLLYQMGQWLIPFIIAIILAYALHVPVRKISEAIHVSRTGSAQIMVLGLIATVGIFTVFLVPIFKNALVIIAQNLPNLLQQLPGAVNSFFQEMFDKLNIQQSFDLGTILKNCISELATAFPSYMPGFINTGIAVAYVIMFLFMTPILTFYLLKDWEKITLFFNNFLKRTTSPTIIHIIKEIDLKLSFYIKGQLIVCLILSGLYIAGLFLVGVEKFLICGFFSGLLSIAPFFGPLIALLVTFAISIETFSSGYQYLSTILVYLVIPFIDSNFITPRFIGKKTGIQPVWLLFTICLSVSTLGTIGIFISVPIAVIFSTVCKELVKKYKFA